jgi:hypoxanthine-DNA glycosylase
MLKSALLPIVDHSSTILILGTMPGEKSIELQQYYGNKGNLFWKILFLILHEPFSINYDERKALLSKHGIALWNALAACEREGSRDDKIRNPVVNDFKTFFQAHPNIRYVFFESIAAARMYAKYAFKSDAVSYFTLPSTSGLNAGISFDDKLRQWQQLTKFIAITKKPTL